MQMSKRGQLSGGLIGGILLLVLAVVMATIGLSLLDGLDDDFAAGSLEANASADGRSGIANITSKAPLIGTIIVSVFLLTLVAGIVTIFRNR